MQNDLSPSASYADVGITRIMPTCGLCRGQSQRIMLAQVTGPQSDPEVGIIRGLGAGYG